MKKIKESFSFSKKNLKKADSIISKFPFGKEKSAVLPLLDLAQRQNDGWLSTEAIEYVADYISEPFMKVYEVATFYSMYNLEPIGKYHIQVCGTTPCWLRGSEDIMKACEKYAKTKSGQTSKDSLFTISEVECLGACVNGPIVQINDDFYEDLDEKKIEKIIKNFQKT